MRASTAAALYGLRRGEEIPMRDGTILRADVWLPAGDGPWPTLLERLPYNRSSSFDTQHIVGLEVLRALDAGFAVVMQDTRGRYGSDGDFTPFVDEAADGEDTIAWIRAQHFSDGRVAMFGASYVGATQMLAATKAPQGLVAIAPQLSASEYYDGWTYSGGALQLGFVLLWIIESLGPPDVLRRDDGARAAAERTLQRLLDDPFAAFDTLPLLTEELSVLAPYLRDWLTHPTRDEYWNAVAPSAHYGAMDVAGLHIAGWHDIFLEGGLRNYVGMRRGAATEWAQEHQYLVVGPWSHGNPSDWQGNRWHGYPAAAGAVDLTAVHLEFFGAMLEQRTPELPRVRLFTTGVDRWRDEDDWPLARATQRTLYLHSGGNAATDPHDGLLSEAPPAPDEPADRWVSNPADPVPTVGGATFLPGLILGRNSGQMRQEAVERRDDVLVFTGAQLERDLEVTGEVVLELQAASEATDCDWTARLVDVDASGVPYGVVDGILRARYRHGLDRPQALEAGRPDMFRVVLGNISHVFLAGHRLRLQVASSNFPRFDRNPQQFIAVGSATAADFRAVTQTVFHDAGRPSRLILPVVA